MRIILMSFFFLFVYRFFFPLTSVLAFEYVEGWEGIIYTFGMRYVDGSR